MSLQRGPCIAYDGDKEIAWMLVDPSGNYLPFNDEGALYVLSTLHEAFDLNVTPAAMHRPRREDL